MEASISPSNQMKLPYGLRAAKVAAERSTQPFKVGACLEFQNQLIVAWNQSKTSPKAARWYEFYEGGQSHAEFNLFSNFILDKLPLKRAKVYVYRQLPSTGALALARPCKYCIQMLRFYSILDIMYTVPGGYVQEKL